MATVETIRLSERPPAKFEMRDADFGEDVNHEIESWLHEQIRVRKEQLRNLFETKVPEWRRLASGQPREETKSWPFENCSNLVYPLIGQEIDDLAARVLGFIYATAPLQHFAYYTRDSNQDQSIRNGKKARILEEFMDYVGYEPDELDLYTHDAIWLSESARLGIAWVKAVPEKRVEAVDVRITGTGKKRSIEGTEVTIYSGPKVSNIEFEDMLFDPDASCPEDSEILAHRRKLSRKQMEDRVAGGWYDSQAVESLWNRPDRYGPDDTKRREDQKEGVNPQSDHVLAEWDIYECWFAWRSGRQKYRLIVSYHYETRTVLRRIFNFMPDNDIPILRTKIDTSKNGILGDGYGRLLAHYQEEISTRKNQRADATTFGILGINRVDPSNKNIDRYFQQFPGAIAPFRKDDFEHIPVGNPSMSNISMQDEQMLIQEARERTGVGPAVAGAGAGQGKIGTKGQIEYGSMGTLAVLQDSNTRVAHRTSDFRHARVKLAHILVKMYGAFGLGRQGTIFGDDQKLLMEALEDFLQHRVRIPIRSSSGSVNREVEKQNGILLSQHLVMYQKNVIQMLQAMENPQLPPHVKEFFVSAIKSLVAMEKRLLRDFGFEQPEEFAPEPNLEDQNAPAARIAQMAQSIERTPGSGGNVPVPGMASVPQGPAGLPTGGGGAPGAPS